MSNALSLKAAVVPLPCFGKQKLRMGCFAKQSTAMPLFQKVVGAHVACS